MIWSRKEIWHHSILAKKLTQVVRLEPQNTLEFTESMLTTKCGYVEKLFLVGKLYRKSCQKYLIGFVFHSSTRFFFYAKLETS